MKKISDKQRVNDLEIMNRITSKSKFTEKDIKELSEKIKKGMTKRFLEYCTNKNKSKNT